MVWPPILSVSALLFGPWESAWQSPVSRCWFPIPTTTGLPSRLCRTGKGFMIQGHELLMPHARSLSPETCVSDGPGVRQMARWWASIDLSRRVGTTRCCMTGSCCVARGSHAIAAQAGCSFTGGGLATDADDGPHKLANQMKAEFLIAIAENDDERLANEKALVRGQPRCRRC